MAGDVDQTPSATRLITVVVFVAVVGGALYLLSGASVTPKVSQGNQMTKNGQEAVLRNRLYVAVRTRSDGDQLYEVSASSSPRRVPVKGGWRAEQLSGPSEIRLEQRGSDGFAVMADQGWNVPLRGKTGRLYEAPVVVGLLDSEHALIVARGDALEAISVAKNGSLSTFTTLPDTSGAYAVGGGRLWYATYVQGEGLESEPLGPSELRMFDGRDVQSIATASSVIERILPGPDGGVAYATSRDVTVRFDGGGEWTGFGRPLLWLDAEHVLVTNQGALSLVQRGEEQTSFLGNVPGEAISAALISDAQRLFVVH